MDPHTGRFTKGMKPWNKGIPNTWATNPPKMLGKDNPAWKGNEAGYVAKHRWVYKHFGKANWCEICMEDKPQRYEWANISREYKRVRGDWMMMCVSCHRKRDNRYNREKGVFQ